MTALARHLTDIGKAVHMARVGSVVAAVCFVLVGYALVSAANRAHQDELNEKANQLKNALMLQFSLIEQEVATLAQILSIKGVRDLNDFDKVWSQNHRQFSSDLTRVVAYAPILSRSELSLFGNYYQRNTDYFEAQGYPDLPLLNLTGPPLSAPLLFVDPPSARQTKFGIDLTENTEGFRAVQQMFLLNQPALVGPYILSLDAQRGDNYLSLMVLSPVVVENGQPSVWQRGVVAAPVTPEVMLSQSGAVDGLGDYSIRLSVNDADAPPIEIAPNSADIDWMDRVLPELIADDALLSLGGRTLTLSVSKANRFSPTEAIMFVVIMGSIFAVIALSWLYLRHIKHASGLVQAELLERESELRASERRIAYLQNQEAIGELVGGVAHDFNNILAIVLANAELLLDMPLDENGQDCTNEIRKSASRGTSLSRQLLAFGKRSYLEPKAHRVDDLLGEAMVLFKRIMPASIEISSDVSEALPPVQIDRNQLETAFLNLAINARDAMPDGGKFTLTAQLTHITASQTAHLPGDLIPGEYVRVRLRDTGFGMSKALAEKVFDPFVTSKKVGTGSGLGLSMVQGFMRQSGGTIYLQTQEGSGTTVVLLLPVARSLDAESSVETKPRRASRQTQKTILLVEDERGVRLAMTRQLRAAGHNVVAVNSGNAALQVLDEKSNIDLIISDMVMPGALQGVGLASEVRNRLPDLPILLMSGYPKEIVGANAEMSPLPPMVQKPVSRDALLDAVRVELNLSSR